MVVRCPCVIQIDCVEGGLPVDISCLLYKSPAADREVNNGDGDGSKKRNRWQGHHHITHPASTCLDTVTITVTIDTVIWDRTRVRPGPFGFYQY